MERDYQSTKNQLQSNKDVHCQWVVIKKRTGWFHFSHTNYQIYKSGSHSCLSVKVT